MQKITFLSITENENFGEHPQIELFTSEENAFLFVKKHLDKKQAEKCIKELKDGSEFTSKENETWRIFEQEPDHTIQKQILENSLTPYQRDAIKKIKEIREKIELIQGNPADVKLLRQELNQLKDTAFYFRSVADLRRSLCQVFEENFFNRSARRFFGDTKYRWSSKEQTLTVETRKEGVTRSVFYVPTVNESGEITLKCI